MLQILLNNTPLDLKENTEIRIEENFPYFDMEGTPTSTVWHFDVPVTAHNEKLFNYANYVMVRQKFRMYQSRIVVHGIPIGAGKLILTNTEATSFRVSVLLNDFGVEFEGVKMNDTTETFDLGGNQTELLQAAKDINAGTVSAPFRFPIIYAPGFYGEDNDYGKPELNKYFLRYLNNYDYGADAFIPNDYDKSYNALSPQFMITDAIATALAVKKWQMTGDVKNLDFFKRLVVLNNQALDKEFIQFALEASYSKDSYNNLEAELRELPDGTWSSFDNWPAKPMQFDLINEDETGEYFNGRYRAPAEGWYEIKGSIDLFNAAMNYLELTSMQYICTVRIMVNDTIKHSYDVTFVPQQDANKNIDWLTTPPQVFAYRNDEIWFEMKLQSTGNEYYSWYYDDHMVSGLIKHNVPATLSSSYVSIKFVTDLTNTHSNVTYANHLPNVNTTEFINNIRLGMGAVLFFDNRNRIVQMQSLNSILNKRAKAYDITPFTVEKDDDTEILESSPLKISFEEESDFSGVYKFIVDHENQLTGKYMKADVLAYATDEMSIYKSKIDGSLLKWEYEGHDYRVFNPDAGKNATEIPLNFSPVRMRSFRRVVLKDGFILELTEVPLDGEVISIEYNGRVYQSIASSDGNPDDGYFYADPKFIVQEAVKQLWSSLTLDYPDGELDFELHPIEPRITISAQTPADKIIIYSGVNYGVNVIPTDNASGGNTSGVTAWLQGIGKSPFIDKDPEDIKIQVGFLDSLNKSAGVPLVSSVGAAFNDKDVNYNTPNSLDEYIEPWAAFFKNREQLTVQLTGISIWEMLEIIKLNKPSEDEENQKRWVAFKGVHYLPHRASFILNINGHVKEAEMIIVKNREE